MKRNFFIKLGFLLGFMYLLPYAHASQVDIYRKEAKAFCELHNPKLWKNRENYTLRENYSYLAKRIRQTVKSPAFLAIFNQLTKTGYTDFYTALQPKISQLIGEPWHCQYAKDFYKLRFVRIPKTPFNGKKLVVTFKSDGSVTLKGKTYKSIKDAAYFSALKLACSKTKNIWLKVPKGISREHFNRLLDPFRKLGIKHFRVKLNREEGQKLFNKSSNHSY